MKRKNSFIVIIMLLLLVLNSCNSEMSERQESEINMDNREDYTLDSKIADGISDWRRMKARIDAMSATGILAHERRSYSKICLAESGKALIVYFSVPEDVERPLKK